MGYMAWILVLAAFACIFSLIGLVIRNTKPNAIAIGFSVVGIIASFVALALAAPRDSSLNIPGFDYLGFIVSIFGILTAVLIGWQLYNAFKLKEDAKKVEAANKNVDNYASDVAELEKKIKLLGEYVENPEWVHVITDAEDRILFGIKKDGSIEWGAGVPKPIREELDALKRRISELEKK